ncbi:MAG: hypothetical protein AAB701_00885 [Patescibacteria group bacterium]
MKRLIYSWLASGLLLGIVLVLGVVLTTPQTTADTLSHIALVLGIVLSLSSLFGFLGLEVRRLLFRQTLDNRGATQAIRQGTELALFLVGWVLLRMYTNLHIWETSLLCLAFVSAEIAMSSHRHSGKEEGAL